MRLLPIAIVCALAACTSPSPRDTAAATDSAAVDTPTVVAAPAAASAPAAWIRYRCESGREVQVSPPTFDDTPISVRYEGATRTMHVVRSASGARYAGEGYEWWTKGTGPGATGMLGRYPSGDTAAVAEPLESCAIPAG